MSAPNNLLPALSRALNLTKTRSSGDPELLRALEEVREVQEREGWTVLRVDDPEVWDGLEVEEEDDERDAEGFREALDSAGIQELRLQEPLEPDLLQDFLSRLLTSEDAPGESPSLRFLGLEDALGLSFRSTGAVPVGMAASIQRLFSPGEDAPPSETPAREPPTHDLRQEPLLLSPGAGGSGERTLTAGTGEASLETQPPLSEEEEDAEAALPDEEDVEPALSDEDQEPALPDEDEEPVAALPDEEDVEPALSDEDQEPAFPDEDEEPVAALPDEDQDAFLSSEELAEMVRAYGEASGDERERLAEEIRAEGVRRREARDITALTDMVEILGDACVVSSSPARARELEALAAAFTTATVASRIVGRLGEVRDEEERARYLAMVPHLGNEVAEALGDALVEARGRYQRRVFMDALVALGAPGMHRAQEMVDDPRWFVVRNGVAILGEMGVEAEEAVSHITGTLANPDPRVRLESVRALGKLGGEDAEMLLVGMLNDQDPEVRAAACRSVGVLKVEKALKPLLQLLEEDEEEDVRVGALQALGQIGDPGAVPVIEKRALGGLFSRPGRDVRIAAYRALAGIGTPKARNLLEKARSDRDREVRAVVEALLEED